MMIYILLAGFICISIYLFFVLLEKEKQIEGYQRVLTELSSEVDKVFAKLIDYEVKYGKSIDTGAESDSAT